MSVIEELEVHSDWVPRDTFGARLALIRQTRGWNVKQAADICGIDNQSWHNWEAGRSPRNYTDVCEQIAEATRCDLAWLTMGGELSRSKCFAPNPQLRGQGQLRIVLPKPTLPTVHIPADTAA